MVSAPESSVIVRFEGYTRGGEIWGGTQANFLILHPGANARETSVILNDPGAEYLAGLLGQEDSAEFRDQAARHVGELWIRRLVEQGRNVSSVIMLGKALLEQDPAVAEELRRWTQKA